MNILKQKQLKAGINAFQSELIRKIFFGKRMRNRIAYKTVVIHQAFPFASFSIIQILKIPNITQAMAIQKSLPNSSGRYRL